MPRYFLILLFLFICFSNLDGNDWPQWRGTNRDAIASESGLLQEWPEEGPKLAWKATGLGGGDSAPAISKGVLYGMSNRDGKEIVWARSEGNGKEIWAVPIGDAVKQRLPQSKEGPACTPTVEKDRLYVIGMGGTVACLKTKDGTLLWQRSFVEDFGGMLPVWSYRESPLIDGEKLVCTPGSNEALIVALEKNSGKTIWQTASETPKPKDDEKSGRKKRKRAGAAYSSVIQFEFEGTKQYAQLTAKALIGFSATDGKVLWKYAAPSNAYGINCSTPIFKDGMVFGASAYGNGGGAIKLSKKDGKIETEEVYFTKDMQNHHGGMIVHEGCLYGANGGNGGGYLACLDFKTGKMLWRDRKGPKGALAFADNRFYLRGEKGKVLLIEPSKEKLIVKGQFDQPDRSSSPAWAHPVIANGKLYIRDQDVLLSYDIKAN